MFLELIIGAVGVAAWRLMNDKRPVAEGDVAAPQANAAPETVDCDAENVNHDTPATRDGWLVKELTLYRATAVEMLDDAAGKVLVFVNGKLSTSQDGVSRQSQLDDVIGVKQFSQPTDAERGIHRNLVVSAGTFGITAASVTVLPALMPLAAISLWFAMLDHVQGGLEELFIRHKVGVKTLEAVSIMCLLLLGHTMIFATFSAFVTCLALINYKARDKSSLDLQNGVRQECRVVYMEYGGVEVEMPFDEIKPGARIVIRAGEFVPADGKVVSGFATIDQHTLTGEERPVEKTIGDEVFAGTFAISGRFVIKVERAGADTLSSKIGDILRKTIDYRTDLEEKAASIAERSVLPGFILAGLTLVSLGPNSALAVISCFIGYQMRYTGPLTLNAYLTRSAQKGVLIKDGRALERVPDVDTVVFDKTGTLTQKVPVVVKVHVFGDRLEAELLQYAAAAEYRQSHPLARAILEETERRGLEALTTDEPTCAVGFGVKALVHGRCVRVGSERFLQMEGISLPKSAHAMAMAQGEHHSSSFVWVAIDDRTEGAIELSAGIRPQVLKAIQQLKDRGLRLCILSGDKEAPTRHLAEELGIVDYFAEVLPTDKSAKVKQLQEAGHCVCFVGDGINDAIALKTAHVSVSIRGATTLALDTAQIILNEDNVSAIVDLFKVADELEASMKRNFAASTVPGVVNVASVFLLHTGPGLAVGLAMAGLLGGTLNSVFPVFIGSTERPEKPLRD